MLTRLKKATLKSREKFYKYVSHSRAETKVLRRTYRQLVNEGAVTGVTWTPTPLHKKWQKDAADNQHQQQQQKAICCDKHSNNIINICSVSTIQYQIDRS